MTSSSSPLAGKAFALDDDALFATLAEVLSEVSRTRAAGAPRGLREPATSLADWPLDAERDPASTLREVAAHLARAQTHTAHARYFGLPNASPSTLSVAGSALAAQLSAQLATRLSAPLAVGIEARLVRELGQRFGFGEGRDGVLTSGGAEANTMAVLAALSRHAPAFARTGVRGLSRDVVVYASAEAHPSLDKALRVTGLGDQALRRVRVDAGGRMQRDALAEALGNDRARGRAVLAIVATAGTTTSGAIDDLGLLSDVATRENAWLHVDAAWGGMLAFDDARRSALHAIERADSITFDPHKALSVPNGLGAFLTRAPLQTALYETGSGYLPRSREGEPYARSLPWSRAFSGLSLFLALSVHGFPAHAAAITARLALGDHLRARLAESGFRVVSDSPLPVACFVDDRALGGSSARHLTLLAQAALRDAGAWLSVARLPGGARVLRAAIVSHHTRREDVDALVSALAAARAAS